MSREGHRLFPPFRLDLINAQLWKGDEQIILRPKTFEVLCYLVDHPGQLVTKDTLLDAVWTGVAVSDSMPAICVNELRRALGDDPKTPKLVQTVHRRGYRFIAPVTTGTTAQVKAPCLSAVKDPKPIMVGREEELEQLKGWYMQALKGRRRIIFIVGEAGIGKTAFVEEFLDSIASDGSTLIGRGHCVEQYGAGEPYMPVLEALSRLSREPDGERVVENLRRFAPSWLAQMPSLLTREERAEVHGEVQGITQKRMLREMAEALEALATESVLVLLLEDLHWSDFSTLELISAIARRREAARLLIVATYRPVEMLGKDHPLRAVKQELELHGNCEELRLKLLSGKDIENYLVRRIAGNAGREFATLAPLIHTRTDGNPLFMVNVVDDLLGRAALMTHGREMSELKAVVAGGFDPPRTIREMIERNLERLQPDEQAMLEGASVVGLEFSAASVAAALERPQDEIEACCTRLSRREQFISKRGSATWPDGTTATTFRFQHALYQQVLYSRLPTGHQLRLHQRIALRQEAGYGERSGEVANELAYHYSRANFSNKAMQYLKVGAERAVARGAMAEAEKLAEAAINLLQRLPEDAKRPRSELALRNIENTAKTVLYGWHGTERQRVVERTCELAEQLGDEALLVRGLLNLASVHFTRIDLPRTLELGTRCLDLAAHIQDARAIAAAHMTLAWAAHTCGGLEEAAAHYNDAIGYAERVGRHDFILPIMIQSGSAMHLSWVLLLLGRVNEAQRVAASGLRHARDSGHLYSLGHALVSMAWINRIMRIPRQVREFAEAAIALSEEHGFPEWTSWGQFHRGWALAELGELRAGVAEMEEAVARFRELGGVPWQQSMALDLALKRASLDDLDQALAIVEESLTHIERTGERIDKAEVLRGKAELLLMRGESEDDAERLLREAIDLAREQKAQFWELRVTNTLARLLDETGHRTEARSILNEARGRWEQCPDLADLKDASTLLERLIMLPS